MISGFTFVAPERLPNSGATSSRHYPNWIGASGHLTAHRTLSLLRFTDASIGFFSPEVKMCSFDSVFSWRTTMLHNKYPRPCNTLYGHLRATSLDKNRPNLSNRRAGSWGQRRRTTRKRLWIYKRVVESNATTLARQQPRAIGRECTITSSVSTSFPGAIALQVAVNCRVIIHPEISTS